MLLGQKTGNDYIIYLYDENGTPYGIICNNTYYYYVQNAQGDIIGILDADGNTVVEYTYSAWGETLSITGSLASTIGRQNPLRYRGYYYDTESGFYYLQSRYYDPVICRFINADGLVSTGQGLLGYNMFAYCGNNPVNRADYCGNKPGDLFDTMDEAAKDFAEYINEKSIKENLEYGSFIYSKSVWETKKITYYNPNLFGNNFLSYLWNYIFRGGLTKTITKRVRQGTVLCLDKTIPKTGDGSAS